MATNPQMIMNLSKDFFRRNNPVDAMVRTITETVLNIVTFNSKMKLLKYKFMLAQQQMQLMESNLHQGSQFNIKGVKIDKIY
jgi:hypothetical protein